MKNAIKVSRQFRVRRGQVSPVSKSTEVGRVPRISRLMALAIQFDQFISNGVVADEADLARLGQVSRARLTQIMNLVNLAPDIQEQLLALRSPENGREWATERHIRPVVAEMDWRKQRRMWSNLL
jgi:hypothetical protein